MFEGKLLLARLAMISFCTILFAGHSRKELQKFLMGLKSTGTTVKLDRDLRYPIIAYCHKNPFKTNGEKMYWGMVKFIGPSRFQWLGCHGMLAGRKEILLP